MAITVLHDWQTDIDSAEVNSKFALVEPGILTGGTITGDPANPQVEIAPFTVYSRDGLLVTSDAPEVVSIPAEAVDYYICLRVRYDPVGGTIPTWITTLDPFVHPETAYLIIFHSVNIPLAQGHVNAADLSYVSRQEVDYHGRFPVRGSVAAIADLPTIVMGTDGKKLIADDIYYVQATHQFYYWDDPYWFPLGSSTAKAFVVRNISGADVLAGTAGIVQANSGALPRIVTANPTGAAIRGVPVWAVDLIPNNTYGLATIRGLVSADCTGINTSDTVYAGAAGAISRTRTIEHAQRLGVCTTGGLLGRIFIYPDMYDEDNEQNIYQWVYLAAGGPVIGLVTAAEGTTGVTVGVRTFTNGSDEGVPMYLSQALLNVGDYGYALVQGLLTGIDATGGAENWTAGMPVYAKYDTGAFSRYPYPTYEAQRLGIVMNAANPGTIYFYPTAKNLVGASNAMRILVINTTGAGVSLGDVLAVTTLDATGIPMATALVASDVDDQIPVMATETIANGDAGWCVVFGQVDGVDTTVAPALGVAGTAFYSGMGAPGKISPYAAYGYHQRLGVVLVPGVSGSVFFYPEPRTYQMAGEAVRQLVFNDTLLNIAANTVVCMQDIETTVPAACPFIVAFDPTSATFVGRGSLGITVGQIDTKTFGYITTYGSHPIATAGFTADGQPLHSNALGALVETPVSETCAQIGHIVKHGDGTIFVNPVSLTHKIEYPSEIFMAGDAALEGVSDTTNTSSAGAPRRNIPFPVTTDAYARWIIPIPAKLKQDIIRADTLGLPNAQQVDFTLRFYCEVPTSPAPGTDVVKLNLGYRLYSALFYTTIGASFWNPVLSATVLVDHTLPVYGAANALVFFVMPATGVTFRDANLLEIHFERQGSHANDTYDDTLNLITGEAIFTYPYSTI